MMKSKETIIFLAALLLTGCAATISIKTTDPVTGAANITEVKTARRVAIAVEGDKVTIISGQVLIDDATVQALGRGVTDTLLQTDNK